MGKAGDYWRKKEAGTYFQKLKQRIFRKKLDEETLNLIKKVAWELSRIFPLYILANSTLKSKDRKEGKANDVDAYILLRYPQYYRKLIFDNRVIDLACLYARRDFKPQILNLITLEDLKKFRPSLMFIEKTELKNYHAISFTEVVIFTKNEFYDSISKEHDAKINWNGWETIGKKLYLNMALMTFISDDLPMVIATYTPGKSSIFYEADFNDEEKQHAKERILTKAYHQVLVQLATSQKKIDKTEKLATSYAKMLSDATKEAERQQVKNFRKRIEDIDRRKEEMKGNTVEGNGKPKIVKNWTPIITAIIILVGLLILLLFYLRFQFANSGTPSGIHETSFSTYRILLNILGMRI